MAMLGIRIEEDPIGYFYFDNISDKTVEVSVQKSRDAESDHFFAIPPRGREKWERTKKEWFKVQIKAAGGILFVYKIQVYGEKTLIDNIVTIKSIDQKTCNANYKGAIIFNY